MMKCWEMEPENRPSFDSLCTSIRRLETCSNQVRICYEFVDSVASSLQTKGRYTRWNLSLSRRDQSHRVNWPFLLQNLVAGTIFSPCD